MSLLPGLVLVRPFEDVAVAFRLMTRDPSERPTEHLQPHAPVAREAVVTSEVVDPLWVERLEDQVRSLKGLVSLATLLALAGVGLSLYLLLRDDGDRRDASRERVARLDSRIDRLEGRVGRASDETDVSRLTDQLAGKADTESVQALSDEVQQLKASVDDASSGDDTSADAVVQLDERVDALAQQVEDLSSQTAP